MKYNPMASGDSIGASQGADTQQKQIEYYQRIQEMCPNIIEHDDEEANEEYFAKKMLRAPEPKAKTALEDLKMFGQF